MLNYYFGGINAAGKSTFLSQLKATPGAWEVVHGSQALMEWLGIAPGDYASLRALPRAQTNQAYADLVLHRIQENGRRKSLIFDSHYLNLIEGVVHKTVEGDWLGRVDALVLLAAQPTTIHDRIRRDADRDRKLFRPDANEAERMRTLEAYIRQTIAEFQRLAAQFRLPSVIVYNEDGKIDDAIGQFLDFDGRLRAAVRG